MRKALVALIVFVPLVAFASGEGESPQASGVAAEVILTSLPREGQSDYNLSDYQQLTGTVIGSYSQSPILDARVASGELPPVEDRLPDEPLVSVPFREIGRYGGTMTLPGVGKNNWWPGVADRQGVHPQPRRALVQQPSAGHRHGCGALR